jgi:transcriptional regulator with XRE-family HTH domain
MTELGKWLLERRQAAGLTMGKLGEMAKVDNSTISRLENNQVDPTWETMFLLCWGLLVGLDEFISYFYPHADETLYQRKYQVNEWNKALTYLDIHLFKGMFEADPLEACSIIAVLLNQITNQTQDTKPEALAQNEKYTGLPKFTAESIFSILLSNNVIALKPYYPSLDPYLILYLYQHSAVVTFLDVAAYIKQRQIQTQTNLLKHFPKTLVKNLEEGLLDNFRVNDVLLLDSLLGKGEIIGMFWYVTHMNWSFSLRRVFDNPSPETEPIKAATQLFLCLWRQHEHDNRVRLVQDEMPDNLLEIRNRLQKYSSEHA